MTLTLIFGTAFVVGLSGAMMPGPFLTQTVSEALSRGFWAGPLMVLGHGLLEGSLVAALTAGLAQLVTRPAVAHAVAILGGLALVLLGSHTAREAWLGRVKLILPGRDTGQGGFSSGGRLPPVAAGAVTSAANPFWLLWWATIGLSYVNMALARGMIGLAVFYGGHILSDLAWYSLVAAAVTAGRQLFGPATYRNIVIGCGAALSLLGFYFLYTGSC